MVKIEKKIVSVEVVTLAERTPVLVGKTYKIQSPIHPHAFYVTINDLYDRPFEMFIHSKNMAEFQWITALTRVISAVFRTSKDPSFLVEELHSVFDPKGGYWKKGKYINSLVAEIGDVIEQHIGMVSVVQTSTVCPKCNHPVANLGGCKTCTNCGDSKCD